jgi:hypothetical protein
MTHKCTSATGCPSISSTPEGYVLVGKYVLMDKAEKLHGGPLDEDEIAILVPTNFLENFFRELLEFPA